MTTFELNNFLPYLLNQAAEGSSLAFRVHYRDKYGMLRTEWRVLFHLWRYGEMTAHEICLRSGLHKTKVSRAVRALEDKRMLQRQEMAHDRRNEVLSLTKAGKSASEDLSRAAERYNDQLLAQFTPEERRVLHKCLLQIGQLPARSQD
ncbi:MAG: hypothetical protein RIR95_1273 [Pseudomonadota bacterium]|jgi:DNA-binding MarR family transcriptional regulator